MLLFQPDTEDKWTVYGRVKTGLDAVGQVQMRGLHLDRAASLEQANAFVEAAIAQFKEPCVLCVIVFLKDGRDDPTTRRVVRRVSEAKAWFE